MSAALMCDNCGDTLAVDRNGDDALGESAAWLEVSTSFGRFDCCSRSCAGALLESDEFVAAHDAQLESITEIARIIAEGAPEEPSDG